MGYYLNLVNHEKKIICEACKCGKEDLNPYFDSDEQRNVLPLFIQYCNDNSLKIEVMHDLELDNQELYHKGYIDFSDTLK